MKNNIRNFLNNKEGAVTIEFFFMFLFLMAIFAFMLDLVIVRSSMGKLDSASYSLVNILRERTSLYGKNYNITNNDLAEYEKLAKLLVFGDKNSTKTVHVVLEYKSSTTERTLSTNAACKPYESVNTLWKLAPYSEDSNEIRSLHIPIYQVTLCIEMNSLFRRVLVDKAARTELLVRSSSMSVSR